MMPDLDCIYDRAFFEEWGAGNEIYVRSAEHIANVLFDEFKPKRVVDLGAGCGVYSHFLSQKGVEILVVDGVRPPSDHAFPVPFHIQDLTVPFENTWGRFDFALCLEVAEHIPEPLSGSFLDNLIRFSDRVILSAAPPNQGGHHHVNEQPKRYWVKLLAERGYLYNRPRTGKLVETFKVKKPGYMWMVEHISVYERGTDPWKEKQDLPFSVRQPLNASRVSREAQTKTTP